MREGGGRLDGGQVNRGSVLRQKVWEAKIFYFIPTANPFRRTHSPLPPPSQLALAKATLVQEQARSEELARQVGDGNEGLNTLAQV